jgi:hypothetical protein
MGSATILAGNTYVDVPHGLSFTPTIDQIVLTPQDALGGRSFWPTNPTSTTFRINIDMADPDTNHTFSWQPITQVAPPSPPQPPSPTLTGLGVYTTADEVQAHLNASYDATSQVYTVFGLPVYLTSFQAHVDHANLYVNSIVGSVLSVSDQRYDWAKMAALELACLRVLVAASGGMLLGAFDYRLGDLYITKASIGRLAFEGAVKGFHDDLLRMLTNFATPVVAAEASAKDDVPTYKGGLMNP